MAQIDSSWKGFKTTLSRLKKPSEEGAPSQKFTIVIEGDESIEEFEDSNLPTSEALKEIFENSKKITAYIYSEDRLMHKQVLQKEIAKQVQSTSFQSQEHGAPNLNSAIQSLTEQMKMMMNASEEINKMRLNLLQDSFKSQIEATQSMYARRDETIAELTKREIELKTKEIEINSKRKTEILESVIMGIGSGLKEVVTWAKENPGDAAEIFAFLRSKPVA